MAYTTRCKILNRQICWLYIIVAAFYTYDCNANTVTLSSQPEDYWEDMDVTLTCSYDGTLSARSFYWSLNRIGLAPQIVFVKPDCIVQDEWLNNSTQYDYRCHSNTTHSVTLKNVTLSRQGEIWQCIVYLGANFGIQSNTAQIFVKVPVRVSSIRPDSTLLALPENSTIAWQCKSSECRPKPKFRWFLESPYGNSTTELDKDTNEIASDGIQAYTSKFSFILNRTWNMWFLFCGANSKDNSTFVLSAKIQLNVTYPPDGPPKIRNLEDGNKVVSTVNIIIGGFVNLECSVSGGNPLPRLEWNINNDSPQSVSGLLVRKNISFQVTSIDSNTELKCQSIHAFRETSIVSVNVLYPPATPVITVKTISGNYVKVILMLDVIEGTPYTVNCSAKSNPPVSLFKWNDLPPSSNSILYVGEADRGHAETVTCNVSNVMQISDTRPTLTGMNMTQLKVKVLYPPKVNILRDATIIEGEEIDYTCNFTQGKPSASNITWSREGTIWDGQHLQIRNVSRNQAGVYMCSVHNIMAASDGNRELGISNRTFNLSVQYKTNILKFFVNDHERNRVWLSENETVNISCEIEGDPFPTGELLHQRDCCNLYKLPLTFTASKQSPTLRLSSVFKTQCSDTGLHTCTGSNTFYNGWQSASNKSISLFVNCSPRTYPSFEVKNNITSPLNTTATFHFTAMAYPPPNVQWYRTFNEEEASEAVGGDIENINISTNVMQIKLTLEHVQESHYGEYLLNLTNQYGTFQQRFYLIPEGKPNPPTYYDFYPDSVTSDSVTVWWEPGFDGGLPQSFIISYNLTVSKWYNESAISHNKERRMNKTITELTSGSVYHILIYAHNEKGAVRVPHAIIVNTNELQLSDTLTKSKSVGPAIGGTVGALLAVITVTVSLVIVRKRKTDKRTSTQNKARDLNDLHTYQNFQNDRQSSSEGPSSAVYERLHHTDSEPDQQYQQLATLTETDAANQKIYENLKLTQQNRENNARGSCPNSAAHTQGPAFTKSLFNMNQHVCINE